MLKSPYSTRRSDNGIFFKNVLLFNERSWKKAEERRGILDDAYSLGIQDGVTEAVSYGDAYLSIVAEDCGMSMAKFMGILCKHGVALAKK